MTQKEFIQLLVKQNVCSQYEAEQYTYPCGSTEWCYKSPFTKDYAISNETGNITINQCNPGICCNNMPCTYYSLCLR